MSKHQHDPTLTLSMNTPLVCICVSNIHGDGLQHSNPVIAFRGFNFRCVYRSCASTVVWQRYQKASKSLFHYKRESLLIGVILVKPDFLKATTKAMNAKTIETRMAVFQIIPESNVNLRFHLKSKQRSG